VRQVLEAVAGGSADALALPCDVSVPEHVETVFTKAMHVWGRIDVLFNNAGRGSPARTPDDTDVRDWLDIVNVNLTGSFLCARQAFGHMRRQSPMGGRIINNGSVPVLPALFRSMADPSISCAARSTSETP